MSFDVVMRNLEKPENILPIYTAWSDLVYSHEAGFITYRVTNNEYAIDSKNYSRKVKEWKKKRDELRTFSSQDIALDLLPKSPVTIGKELLEAISDRCDDEKRDIFTALGYGKITGLDPEEKIKLSIVTDIRKSFKRITSQN